MTQSPGSLPRRRWRRAGRGAAALLALALLAVMGGSPSTTPAAHAQTAAASGDDFYGLNFVQPSDPWLTLARDSGAHTVRWQFNWRDIEPSPGSWNWSFSDSAIPAWNKAGIKVDALLHNPPDWAKINPTGLVPANAQLAWNDPANGWAQYCYQFANRYKGQIASYEVWNEPDIGDYWEGTAQQYFYVLKSCYLAIKAADPSTPVAMAGMALLIEKDFFPTVVRLAYNDPDGARNNYYFDAANIHMYVSPELVYTLTRQTHQLLVSYGMGDKPVWITETNIPLRGAATVPDYPNWRYATPEEASWYVWQAIGNAVAAGASRLMFFRLADDGMDEAYGLVAGDGTVRPSYRALQTATGLIHDIVSADREVRSGIVITTLRRADGARIVTMYSVAGRTVNLSIRAEATAGVLINAVGGHSTITPGPDGNYTVTLLPARGRDFSRLEDYSVGGPPQIVIEYDRDGPTSAVDAALLAANPLQVAVSWQGDDGEYGTGVATFDVEVSSDGATWQPWLTATTASSATYDLPGGGTYYFRARAIDRAGNVGPYSAEAPISLFATISARVVDLRGQPVPSARVTLDDGSLYDADSSGQVTLTFDASRTVQIDTVDGSAQGAAAPPPVNVTLGQVTSVTWMLHPSPDLIKNGAFEDGLAGWQAFPGTSAEIINQQTDNGTVLRLTGARKPWGVPGVSTTISLPANMDAALLSFAYRMPVAGQTLRLRAISGDTQVILWHTADSVLDFTTVRVDLSAFAGRSVELHFELWGDKGSGSSIVELDNVICGNVPIQTGGD